jgi:PAS domain S-box-containing protein
MTRNPGSGKPPPRGKKVRNTPPGDQRIREEMERLHLQNEMILNAAGEGIFGLNTRGEHTFVNPAAARMLGYEVDELIGRNSHTVCHHTREDGTPYPEEECPIYAAFRDGKVHTVENERFWRRDGSSFAVQYISTPILEDGELVGAVVAFDDITERTLAARRLAGKTKELEEANVALRTLLRHRDRAIEELEEDILANVRELILPSLDQVEEILDTAGVRGREHIGTIRANLSEITSSFSSALCSVPQGLTPREIQVAEHIRRGRTSKEIARTFNISKDAVDFHRSNLRRKLGLAGKRENLRSHLITLGYK